jgi:hypothetical protein
MTRKIRTAKQHANSIRNIFFDQYENELEFTEDKIEAMTEAEAHKFVQNHIENMIAINGISELWSAEREAAKDLKIKINY